ncbi:MAG: S9 family peptidase [Saprospiraceae bacterium]|nr:S9 family peptidase [Saprospiraceae bacterium]
MKKVKPPTAEKKPHKLEIHGDLRQDPYYWIRNREEPEVRELLEAENQYTGQYLAHTSDLREKLYHEITGRLKKNDESVPYLENGYYYLRRYREGMEYPIYARKKSDLDAEEELLLDANRLAEPHEYYAVGSREVSPDNRILAFSEDVLGRRIYTIRFKDLETGELLEDKIPYTSGGIAWANDNQTVFYTLREPETLRAYKIMRHRLGTPVSEDREVFEESDPTFSSFAYRSKSGKYIIIGSYQTLSQEYRVIPADDPERDPRVLQPRQRGLEYEIAHFEDRFYIRTNWEAQNFRLMVCAEDAGLKEEWLEVIPHRADVLLEDIEIFKNFLVLSERVEGITQLRVREWKGDEHYISFPEEAHLAYTSVNREFDTDQLRLGYTSMVTPNSIYDYDMKKRHLQLKKRDEVLGGFDIEQYESERLMAPSKDGSVEIPISLVYRRDFKRNASHPLLLYGYGAYGNSMEPYFSPARLSLLDRGFAFAIAHVRGGEEMGRQWYEDGKLLNKKNSFHDFIDCAEFLIRHKYTGRGKAYAMGGSAGGLLVGAVANMRPDLWNGIIAAVPFVDVITTMLDESIPLTTFEYDEWGDPRKEEYYHYIKAYSPYDNVSAKAYPAMLITCGLHDSQVQYWEPVKWGARLREMKTSEDPILLHINMEAGHSGASGRFRRYRETALEYAFLLDREGIEE